MPTGPVRKPAGSRITAENTAGKLDIDIPPQGLGGSNIGTGLFALAWNAFVAFWTVRLQQLHGYMCRLCQHKCCCKFAALVSKCMTSFFPFKQPCGQPWPPLVSMHSLWYGIQARRDVFPW